MSELKSAEQRCAWHAHSKPLDGDEPWNIACECGTMLDTKECDGCGRTFLNWGAKGYDDIMSAPCATPDGDLACIRCAREAEKAERERDEEEYDDFDPYEAAGESRFGLPGGGRSL